MSVERLLMSSEDYIEMLFHWHRYLLAGEYAKDRDVLDVACGDGYGANELASVARSVAAADIDAGTIHRAQALYSRENLRFIQSPAEQLSFPNQSFDVVASFETIEHLKKEAHLPFLAEVKRVLRPGGLLLISTPDKARTERFAEKNPYHFSEMYLNEFRQLLNTQFKYVAFAFQEINLISAVWTENGDSSRQVRQYIDWKETGPTASAGPMSLHLYVVAMCADVPLTNEMTEKMNGDCMDVGRKPLEMVWHRTLKAEDALKLREAELERLKQIEVLQSANIRSLELSVSELEVELKQRASDFKRLTEEQKDLEAEVDALRSILCEKEDLAATLQRKVDEIHQMRTWQLIERYRQVMDHSAIGSALRPVRDVMRKLF